MRKLISVTVCVVLLSLCGCVTTHPSRNTTYTVWDINTRGCGTANMTKIIVSDKGDVVIYNPSRWYQRGR